MITLAELKAKIAAPNFQVHGTQYSTRDFMPTSTTGITNFLNQLYASNGRTQFFCARNEFFEYTKNLIYIDASAGGTCEDIPMHNAIADEIRGEIVTFFTDRLERVTSKTGKTRVFWSKSIREDWNGMKIHCKIGIDLDSTLKTVFKMIGGEIPRNDKFISDLPKGAVDILSMFRSMNIVPVTGGLKVAMVPPITGDPCSTVCYHTCVGCAQLKNEKVGLMTEIDLVGFDVKEQQCVLVEMKTYKNKTVDQMKLKQYLTQAWLNWVLFSLSYPSLSPYTRSILVVVSLVSHATYIYNVRSRTVTPKMRKYFPFLAAMCPERLHRLTPVNSRPSVKSPSLVFVKGSWDASGPGDAAEPGTSIRKFKAAVHKRKPRSDLGGTKPPRKRNRIIPQEISRGIEN
uniref:Uncharacterized protein n=1 Tax=Esocid herpesvirus 1 TaxID=1862331 RepID=A0A192GQ37_9VIRU|nr:hypothetical protein EsHV1_ORF60 [Esocid herpesvirus 1]